MLVRWLHVVQPFFIGLPNLDPRLGHRFTLHPFDAALNLAGLPLRPVGDIVAQLVMGRIFHMERSEHRGLGAGVRFVVVHDHRQHGQAQDIGQQNELLSLRVGDVTGLGQELDALEPFGLGQLHLARKPVQVPNQTEHDFFESGIRCVGQAFEHRFGDVVYVQVFHGKAFFVKGVTQRVSRD
jgi:hypothetical protein